MNLTSNKILVLMTFLVYFERPGRAQVVQEVARVFKDSTTNYVGIIGYGSTSHRVPFWMHANQFGTVPQTAPAGSIRLGLERYQALAKKNSRNIWRAGLGGEAVGNAGKNVKLIFPQLHGTLRYKNWEIFVGRKKQRLGLADSALGTGSYAWSGNALPIPKIQIGTIGFVNAPFTKGWVSFNAFYSDGLFEKGRPVTSGLKLHQKALYLRVGDPQSRFKFLGGFNHQVQWGGYSPFETKSGKLPDGFKNYINAITGQRYFIDEDHTAFDYNNRIGNHLGSIDLAVQYVGYEYSWFIYRQNLYEDGSLSKLLNIADGLNGISIKKENSYGRKFEATRFVFEFLYTKSQGGAIWDLTKKLGRDNYFNNSQIRDAWSYFGRGIGTPFIPPSGDTSWNWPTYANFFTSNNRVSVFHIGLEGTLFQHVIWTSKLSHSRNSGSYDLPFAGNPGQFSGLISFQLNIPGGYHSHVTFTTDQGTLYPNATGITLGIRKNLF